MVIVIPFVLTEMKQVVMVFSFVFRFSAESVWKVQRRYTKDLEETDESEDEDQQDNSKDSGTQLSSVVF